MRVHQSTGTNISMQPRQVSSVRSQRRRHCTKKNLPFIGFLGLGSLAAFASLTQTVKDLNVASHKKISKSSSWGGQLTAEICEHVRNNGEPASQSSAQGAKKLSIGSTGKTVYVKSGQKGAIENQEHPMFAFHYLESTQSKLFADILGWEFPETAVYLPLGGKPKSCSIKVEDIDFLHNEFIEQQTPELQKKILSELFTAHLLIGDMQPRNVAWNAKTQNLVIVDGDITPFYPVEQCYTTQSIFDNIQKLKELNLPDQLIKQALGAAKNKLSDFRNNPQSMSQIKNFMNGAFSDNVYNSFLSNFDKKLETLEKISQSTNTQDTVLSQYEDKLMYLARDCFADLYDEFKTYIQNSEKKPSFLSGYNSSTIKKMDVNALYDEMRDIYDDFASKAVRLKFQDNSQIEKVMTSIRDFLDQTDQNGRRIIDLKNLANALGKIGDNTSLNLEQLLLPEQSLN